MFEAPIDWMGFRALRIAVLGTTWNCPGAPRSQGHSDVREHGWLEKGIIEIVSFPMKNGDFHRIHYENGWFSLETSIYRGFPS